MSLNFNIAIDGYSSCGKSTIAKQISCKYNMRYIDTGAMYRALTLFFMRCNIISNKNVAINKLLEKLEFIDIDFKYNFKKNKSETILNGENVEGYIRGFEVSNNVSIIAQIKEVREKLVTLQQNIGIKKNVVMDGRDIGTKVFPNAKLKLFLTASLEVRARRRYNELKKSEDAITFSEVLNHLIERDRNDIKREINPLIQADDAIVIDNSSMSMYEQDLLIESLIKKVNDGS